MQSKCCLFLQWTYFTVEKKVTKMKLIFWICICNTCLCTWIFITLQLIKMIGPLYFRAQDGIMCFEGWSEKLHLCIVKNFHNQNYWIINSCRNTWCFVWFLPISDVFYFLPLNLTPDFPCHFSIFAHICWFQVVFIPENI